MTSARAVPFVDLARQHEELGPEIEERVLRVLRSGRYIGGPEVEGLEEEFARYCGVSHGAAMSSGTAALHAALLALEVGHGDEVITVANTFVATAEAIVAAGATPVFVDIDPETYTMDPARLEAAITPRTRAVLPVHLFGQPADMEPILRIARARGLAVVEDACQAHGATYRGRRVASFGDVACFSFYPSKNLGAAGEGGIAVTGSADLAARMRAVRDHGQSRRYHHDTFGLNYRLPAVQAAVLRAKLPHLDEWNERRRAHASLYGDLLGGADLALPWERPDSRHVYHLYVVRSQERERLREHLSGHEVGAGIHYPIPLHLQPPYQRYGSGPGSLPETEMAAGEILSLPMYPELARDQLVAVAEAVRSFARLEANVR